MKIQHAILSMMFLLAGLAFTAGCKQSSVRGPSGSELTVRTPLTPVVIHRGQSQALEVGIERHGFTDAVQVDLSQLPAGVTVKNAKQSVQTDQATFILTASPQAALVTNHQVKLIASRSDGAQVTQFVSFTVID